VTRIHTAAPRTLRTLEVGTDLSRADVGDDIAGLVLTNDVSTRDVQLTKLSCTRKSELRSGRIGACAVRRGRRGPFGELRL
jgi:2-keto-4-pentenoate hydratase/2-oxohepta-3-ene-1,7-dioic acid hydratase in catechol pathway